MKEHNSSERLREMLGYFDITAADLCKKTGILKSSMSQYLNGLVEMKHDKIGVISETFGVDPAWLMGYDVPMFRNDVPKNGGAAEHVRLIALYDSLTESQQKLVLDFIQNMKSEKE